ncbi:glycosyltransferase family 1 protein [Salicola sp. Rm-C-2C1-2]|uniref:glycosyltransferase family 4 protein n=1 Tax=Salicola sp. Rm-C-2C1-2 TaxID=3141321 RepID=UPI0032E4BA0D
MPAQQIALVTETFPPEINGVSGTLGNLCRELVQRGQQLTIIRPGQRDEPPRGHAPLFGERTLRVRGLPLPGYPELRFGLGARRQLRRLWRHRPPQAVYVATQGPLGWSAVSTARELGIPCLSGFHTNFHQYSSYYGAGFMEALIRRYLVTFHNRTLATLAPTTRLCHQLMHWGIANTHCWSRGVDSQLFNPQRRSQSLRAQWNTGNGPVALYVGRLAAEKNLMQAVTTFERLRECHPSARLVLVGDGPLRQSLERAHPEFIFCGTRRGVDLARHYASADIFLFPSESDTFGNVVTEALASGLAVVAFDRAAAREHITHEINGMKAAPGDSEAFTNAALELADRHGLRRHIGERARAHAQTLDWAVLAEQFERILLNPAQEIPDHGPTTPVAGTYPY